VRLVASYPSTIVGQQNNEVDNCGKGFGFDIEVGVLRCVNIPDEGEALDPDEMLVAANQQTDDMLSMQKAIMCCDSLNNVDFTVGVYVPAGPDGGVLGGTWSLSVLVI
jgi:hypothetical protein